MNGLETKNIIRRRKKPGKSVIIAVIAAALALAIFLITLISPIKSAEIDINGTPSRGLSFDKTSITSKT